MIAAGRQVGDAFGLARQAVGTQFVVETQDCVVIGDVEIAIAPGDPGWGIEVVFAQDDRPVGNAILVLVAQQHELVGRRDRGPRPGKQEAGNRVANPLADAAAVAAIAFRAIGKRHQHIAIGQRIDDPRMIEAFGEAIHLEPFRRARRAIVAPADRL